MLLSLLLSAALAGECVYVGMGDISSVEAPAVIILGERIAEQPDLNRARGVVQKLAKKADVRLAIERIPQRYQPILDRFGRGTASASDLPFLMKWSEEQVWPWKSYASLVGLGSQGVTVVAAGVERGQPASGPVSLAPGFMEYWRDAMGEHPMPLGMEGRFAASMAGYERAVVERALQGWSGDGYLVVVAGRGHVEGGLGVSWQAEQLTEVPVHSIILKAGDDPPCHPGDQLWR